MKKVLYSARRSFPKSHVCRQMCKLRQQVRKDIRDFKESNNLDKVVVLWTANTERFSALETGVNDTKENLLSSISRGEDEVGVEGI